MNSADKQVEDKVSTYLSKGHEKAYPNKSHDQTLLERYQDGFMKHLSNELAELDQLYKTRKIKQIDHVHFRESRDRISILIKTISEIHILENSSSDYLGSGNLYQK